MSLYDDKIEALKKATELPEAIPEGLKNHIEKVLDAAKVRLEAQLEQMEATPPAPKDKAKHEKEVEQLKGQIASHDQLSKGLLDQFDTLSAELHKQHKANVERLDKDLNQFVRDCQAGGELYDPTWSPKNYYRSGASERARNALVKLESDFNERNAKLQEQYHRLEMHALSEAYRLGDGKKKEVGATPKLSDALSGSSYKSNVKYLEESRLKDPNRVEVDIEVEVQVNGEKKKKSLIEISKEELEQRKLAGKKASSSQLFASLQKMTMTGPKVPMLSEDNLKILKQAKIDHLKQQYQKMGKPMPKDAELEAAAKSVKFSDLSSVTTSNGLKLGVSFDGTTATINFDKLHEMRADVLDNGSVVKKRAPNERDQALAYEEALKVMISQGMTDFKFESNNPTSRKAFIRACQSVGISSSQVTLVDVRNSFISPTEKSVKTYQPPSWELPANKSFLQNMRSVDSTESLIETAEHVEKNTPQGELLPPIQIEVEPEKQVEKTLEEEEEHDETLDGPGTRLGTL